MNKHVSTKDIIRKYKSGAGLVLVGLMFSVVVMIHIVQEFFRRD